MAFKIPTFADLPDVTPRAVGTQPSYPQEDPGAAATASFGKGLEKAGAAVVDIAAYQDLAKSKLEESNATLDTTNRLVPLHTQIATETDPAKIAELRQQYTDLLQTSGQAISDPTRRQAWMAKHTGTILQAHADADKRLTTLDRGQAMADGQVRLDTAVRLGASSDDPNAVAGTLAEVNNNLEWMQRYGAITPEQRYLFGKQASQKLLSGRADYLINSGRADDALKLIDANRTELDPVTAETLRQKAETKGASNRASGAALRSLNMAPALPPRTSGGMSVGGAIPARIAQEAQQQGVDPNVALTTAKIESSLGQNLGSRGNIFQLGKSEWAAVGGGQMGQPDTDIKNGVAWVAKTQSEMADRLGRQPEGWETYLAHQQGVAGATTLLNNPTAPAGSLVPPRNISANGGNPDAPASAFIGQWRDKFQKTAAGIGSAPASGGITMTEGDSIGVGFKNTGLPGNPVGGRNPQAVLENIANNLQGNPDYYRGQTVLLSGGTMNDPGGKMTELIAQQVVAIKNAGGNVILAGADTGKFSARNAQLEAIAQKQGVPFAGPLPTDNIHPAPQGYRQYAASAAKLIPTGPAGDQVVGQSTPPAPPAAATQQQGPNRTGLPPLAQVWQSIQTDPALRSDQERYTAFSHAKTMYDAQEADAARTERVTAARQKQALEARVTAIQKDAYSDKPTITARDIVNDPTFDSDPKLREHMIGFINNPPGSGIPAPQSYAAAQSVIDRIRLPEGDPNRIVSKSQIYDLMPKLNRTDFEFALKKFDDLTTGDAGFNHRMEEFFKGTTPQIDRSGVLPGLPQDSKGKAKAYEYRRMVEDQAAAYRAANKNPDDLLNPSKPDYLGKPETLKPYKRTFTEALADFQADNNGPLGAGNADISTPDKLKAAVGAGTVSREQGEAEALRRGWIRPAPVPEQARPDLAPLAR